MLDGKHADVTEKIIQAFYRTYNVLGYGFSEKVYQNALVIELLVLGLLVECGSGSGVLRGAARGRVLR
jgi:GxxExxY protein